MQFQRRLVSYFNPRSPCGERPSSLPHPAHSGKFQSTLPVWGATAGSGRERLWHHHFNPRSPCGERPAAKRRSMPEDLFQSTLPVWGATLSFHTFMASVSPISIHAPRVGSDPVCSGVEAIDYVISIHAPRVGSDSEPTLSESWLFISIHAPRVGSDHGRNGGSRRHTDFNPRSPCGERPSSRESVCCPPGFQSTLPVWGATRGTRPICA